MRITIYDFGGAVREQYCYQNGKKHHITEPAVIHTYYDGTFIKICFYKEGLKHRTFGAACLQFRRGTLYHIKCYNKGLIHNDQDLPARIYIDPYDEKHIYYYQNGVIGRKTGPAYLAKYCKEILTKHYILDGKYYSSNGGPTRIDYNSSGKTVAIHHAHSMIACV